MIALVQSFNSQLCSVENFFIRGHFRLGRVGEVTQQPKVQMLVTIGEIGDFEFIDQRFDRSEVAEDNGHDHNRLRFGRNAM